MLGSTEETATATAFVLGGSVKAAKTRSKRGSAVEPTDVQEDVVFQDPEVWAEGTHERRPDGGRRLLNIAVALVGIVLTLPLMAVIALAIRLSSKGPVIFKQERVGIDRRASGTTPLKDRRAQDRGGRVFTIYKFRTMYDRKANAQVWSRPGDPRVTPVGRFLRAYRLDELPQLFNVLRGDMNVVGPRPEQPKIFTRLSGRFSRYKKRQKVLPGITGMAQVRLPYDQNMDDVRRKVDADLEYIEKRGFWTDVKIMISTVKVLLFRRGSL